MTAEIQSPRDSLAFYGHFSGASSFPVVCRALTKWLVAHGRQLRICDLRQPSFRSDEVEPELRGVPRISTFDGEQIITNMRLLQQGIMPVRDDIRTSGAGLLWAFPEWAWACPPHDRFVGYHVCDVDRVPPHWVQAINEIEARVLTPSKWCASVLRSCGVERRIEVAPHGIDPEVFCPGKPREKRTVPTLRFFSSSETGARKGLPEMVVAWQTLWQRKPGFAKLVVRGAGPLVKREFGGLPGVAIEVGEPLRALAMAQLLRETDLLLVPSRAEGFGLQGVESLAVSTPIVATACTGMAEWVPSIPGGVALVETADFRPCPPGPGLAPAIDPGHLADVIEGAVRGLEQLQAEEAKASAVVRKKWSWENVLTGSAFDRLTAAG